MRLSQFLCAVLLCSPGCERSLTFDAQGVAQGTGEKTYRYNSGAPQLREEYVDGKRVRSRWYKPDGTLVQETTWIDGAGEGIYLREDGSVRTRILYVNGLADGEAKEYGEAGNVTKLVQYRAGHRMSEREPPALPPAP